MLDLLKLFDERRDLARFEIWQISGEELLQRGARLVAVVPNRGGEKTKNDVIHRVLLFIGVAVDYPRVSESFNTYTKVQRPQHWDLSRNTQISDFVTLFVTPVRFSMIKSPQLVDPQSALSAAAPSWRLRGAVF